MDISQTKFLVAGIKKSGYSASKLLMPLAKSVYLYDDDKTVTSSKDYIELVSLGAKPVDGIIDGESKADVLLLSPGIPIDSEIAGAFRASKKRILGEVEFASGFIRQPIIAVSGTNGKTTTCSIIDHVIKNAGYSSKLCGNIGTPIASIIGGLENKDKIVAEISSYQLETTLRFCPHIGVILNITPDHLSRHYTFENYVYVKSKLIMNMSETEYAVLNYDDEVVRNLSKNTRGKVVWFSLKEEVDGAYYKNGIIYYKNTEILNVNDLLISGEHNAYNVLASVACLILTGLSVEQIKEGLKSFKGVKHRIQLVKTVNSVEYYNDSKATNPDATLKAVDAIIKPITLILGGYNKGFSFKEMFTKLKENKKIEHIILTGETAKIMYDECYLLGFKNLSVVGNFNGAIKLSNILASENSAVLLSPATSSFDEFTSYEERGDRFIEIVNKF